MAVVDRADGAVVAEIVAVGGKAAPFLWDISDPDQVAGLAAPVHDALGTPGILVNNAGIYPPIAFESLTLADWRRVFVVNSECRCQV